MLGTAVIDPIVGRIDGVVVRITPEVGEGVRTVGELEGTLEGFEVGTFVGTSVGERVVA